MTAQPASREQTPTKHDLGTTDDSSIRDHASAIAAKAGSGVQDALNSGADAGLSRAADGMESAAEKVRERAEGDGIPAQLTGKTADAMEKAAGYLKEHDSEEIWEEVTRMVKDHPVQAAVGALVAGYFLGKIVR